MVPPGGGGCTRSLISGRGSIEIEIARPRLSVLGYRLHAAVCARTGLPLAWEVKTARDHETTAVPALLEWSGKPRLVRGPLPTSLIHLAGPSGPTGLNIGKDRLMLAGAANALAMRRPFCGSSQ